MFNVKIKILRTKSLINSDLPLVATLLAPVPSVSFRLPFSLFSHVATQGTRWHKSQCLDCLYSGDTESSLLMHGQALFTWVEESTWVWAKVVHTQKSCLVTGTVLDHGPQTQSPQTFIPMTNCSLSR